MSKNIYNLLINSSMSQSETSMDDKKPNGAVHYTNNESAKRSQKRNAKKTSSAAYDSALEAKWQLADLFYGEDDNEDTTGPRDCQSHKCGDHYPIPVTIAEIDDRQRTLLRASWFLISKKQEEVGLSIYTLIFNCAPETKRMFPYVQHNEEGELIVTRQAQFQANRFMQLYEEVVEHLDDLSAINPLLKNLGNIHCRLMMTRGFQNKYWHVFEDCMMLVFRKYFRKAGLTTIQTDETIVIWRCLVSWTTQQIRLSCMECLQQRTGGAIGTGAVPGTVGTDNPERAISNDTLTSTT